MNTTDDNNNRRVFGVLGGMGPLASAEFLRTVYQYSVEEREQNAPIVLLYSDPTVPDRTEALLDGRSKAILDQLIRSLHRLFEFGVSKAMICCVTAHYLFDQLPAQLRENVISLVDVVFEELAQRREPQLLLCTNATRQLRIFQDHPGWKRCEDYVVLPAPADQELIHHEIIYALKQNRDLDQVSAQVHALLARYQIDSFIAGCTELHLVARHAAANPFRVLDPLTILAEDIATHGI